MRVTKSIEVPASHVDAVIKIVCDLCRGEITPDDDSEDVVEICRTIGRRCGHAGKGQQHKVDMCVSCWTKKLMPWLAAMGAVPHVTEWAW